MGTWLVISKSNIFFILVGDKLFELSDVMFPTNEVFNQKVVEKRVGGLMWKNLPVFQIIRVDETMEVKNERIGDAMILKIMRRDNTRANVWAPTYLRRALVGKTLPCYVMPTGMKKCKNNQDRSYYTFDLLTEEELK